MRAAQRRTLPTRARRFELLLSQARSGPDVGKLACHNALLLLSRHNALLLLSRPCASHESKRLALSEVAGDPACFLPDPI